MSLALGIQVVQLRAMELVTYGNETIVYMNWIRI